MADDSTAASLTPDHLAILRHALGEPQHADACQPERVTRNFYLEAEEATFAADVRRIAKLTAHEGDAT